MEIEMKLLSKEMVKPSKPTPDYLTTYKLSLLDQICPERYIQAILFYPINNNDDYETEKTLLQLKQSLSETLTLFYPLAGRMKNTDSVDCNDEGVVFIQTRVDCKLSEFLSQSDICISKNFFPSDPLSKEYDYAPLVSLQVTVFKCGGLTISSQMSHKIVDVASVSNFLNSWARYNTGKEVPTPDMLSGSTLFPAIHDTTILQFLETVFGDKLAPKDEFCKRRFVFDSKAVAVVKAKGRSEDVHNPSSVEALSALFSKKLLGIKETMKGDFGTSAILLSLNLRPRMEPPLPQHAFGNFSWAATSFVEEPDSMVADLVVTINNMISSITGDAIKGLQGDEGGVAVANMLKDMEEQLNSVKVDFYKFSSWRNLGLNEIDFGWGNPIWIGQNGEYISYFMDIPNVIVFQSYGNGGIEAWITLEKDEMEMLENDSEFLEIATKNPIVLKTIGVKDEMEMLENDSEFLEIATKNPIVLKAIGV